MFGGRITAELVGRDVPVRAMTSHPAHADELRRPGVQPVVADMARPETLGWVVQEAGMTAEQAEIGVICHVRAWRNGAAEACTDTYRQLTGQPATTAEAWFEANGAVFAQARRKAPSVVA